ncbi:peptidoglycan/LPS O-acetylase OafA/YrhL [Arthrobacter sp. PvP023]|nr:peptidoglycan/LPS O-acetylase OafA/YrhL [Arthrobacter sp. PvP023]
MTIASTILLVLGGRFQLVAFTNPLIHSEEFFVGVAAALAMQRGWRPRLSLTAAAKFALGAYAAVMWLDVPTGGIGLLMALPFLAVIVSAAGADLQGRRGWLPAKPLIYAGQVSYAFYLVHELVILNLLGLLPDSLAKPVFAVIALAVAISLAIALHHLVELAAQRYLSRLMRSRTLHAESRVNVAET